MDNEIEVMRVLRVPPRGKLVVAVGDRRFEKLSDVPAADIKGLLTAAIGELIVFADGYDTLVDAGVAPPIISPPSKGVPLAHSIEQRQAEFLASLERQREAMRARTTLPPDSEAVISEAAKNVPAAARKTALSIVEQIDAILQRHLSNEPKMAGRSIHLKQAPAGGLHIEVDGEYYQRPGEIEDRDVQLLIKMALKEWEAS
jgi:hypothetical protein